MRTIDLTTPEWRSLGCLPQKLDDEQIPLEHRKKLTRLGLASEKGEQLVATFEGRLMLREHQQAKR